VSAADQLIELNRRAAPYEAPHDKLTCSGTIESCLRGMLEVSV
jgi:hypothetical protein